MSNPVKRIPYLVLALSIIALDLWSKALIVKNFAIHYDSRVVIPGLFHIVHVRNTGAAFGIGANSGSAIVPHLLNFGALAVFLIVVVYSFRAAASDRLLQTGLHLILGGAIGNLIDRFRYGSVVDFLDFFVTLGGREHHWPAFNVADSAICVGIALLFLDMRKKPDATREPAPTA